MWRASTTIAFIGRSQALYETCIASWHDECLQTINPFAITDFRCCPPTARCGQLPESTRGRPGMAAVARVDT
jgi:hypothetical protein